jgi:hypothetical protein
LAFPPKEIAIHLYSRKEYFGITLFIFMAHKLYYVMKHNIILIIAFHLLSLQSFCQMELLISSSVRNDTSTILPDQKMAIAVKECNLLQNTNNSVTNQAFHGFSEQTRYGTRKPTTLITSFDGLGYGFDGSPDKINMRNPSDNSLAVGPDQIVQIVNSQMAIFTKKGKRYDETGKVLYGPVETRNVFRGFGGPCEEINNGDAVVRYDQLARRWLIVMPIFSRVAQHENEPAPGKDGEPAKLSMPGNPGQPGRSEILIPPVKLTPREQALADSLRRVKRTAAPAKGSYCMCYAVSTGPDPFGPYYRYEFVRPLFPDYPRPAVWIDGYYIPTSTGDNIIQKHACVAERSEMLKGNPAKEICFVIDGVNFLNNTDIDGLQLPEDGSPNIMLAAGGLQLHNDFTDNGIYFWKMKPDWVNPEKSTLEGPEKIEVAGYHYQGDGQLKAEVPQPGTNQKLDTQGDKIMSRVVYRRIGNQQSIVAVHSVKPSSTGTGGVRWYEFRVDRMNKVSLFQQGTFAPDSLYRFLPSPAMDKKGNIGIGYSVGGATVFPGQRFAGRLAGDPLGILTKKETILAEGEASQERNLRWEDYTQTAIDPSDDLTIWYVGDYLKKGANSYSTRIGAFRITK